MVSGMTNFVEYPPFWIQNAADHDIKHDNDVIRNYGKVQLIDLLQLTTEDALSAICQVENRFFESVDEEDWEIIKIESVQNQMLYDKYWNEKQSMIKLIGEKNLNERDLFHGTGKESVMEMIETEGFRKEFNTTANFGKGTYFAKNARYSIDYASRNGRGVYKMFQCKVITGESSIGYRYYELKDWPKKSNGLIYDSLVNNISNPSIFVIHENIRAYPMFVIHFMKRY